MYWMWKKLIHLYTDGENEKWCRHQSKQYGGSSKNLKQNYHVIQQSTSGCIPKRIKRESKGYLYTYVHSSIYLQSPSPSVSEWANKMQYIHKMEYYSDLRKEILANATWMNIEDIMLSHKKSKYCVKFQNSEILRNKKLEDCCGKGEIGSCWYK